jgi:hypothetical protein
MPPRLHVVSSALMGRGAIITFITFAAMLVA